MDVQKDNSAADTHLGTSLAQLLADRCDQAQDFIATERQKAERIEAELLEQLDAFSKLIENQDHAAADLTEFESQLQQRREALDAAEKAVKDAESQFADAAERMDQRQEALAKAETELAAMRAEFEIELDEFGQQQENAKADFERLTEREVQLEDEAAATKRQRRRIARELKGRRVESLDEIQRQREQLERDQQSLAAADKSAIDDLSRERDELLKERDELREKLDDQQQSSDKADKSAIDDLNRERDELLKERDELREKLDDQQQSSDTDDSELRSELDEVRTELSDLHRRHDMAIADLKDANHRCNELEKQSVDANCDGNLSADAGFDWEQQKKMLMTSMDTDGSVASEPASSSQDIDMVGPDVKKMIASRDLEIRRLKEQLQQKNDAVTSEDSLNNQIASVVDNDDLVLQEREKLKSLQEELRNKQREAEVDISLQRAKLAREKADIEDKLARLEHQKKAMGTGGQVGNGNEKSKKGGSRWMARLGLSDSDE